MKTKSEISKKDIRISDKYVSFWSSPLSNFYHCKFKEGGKTWQSSEQCFMAKKAEFFGDTEAYNCILRVRGPKEAKEIGRQVKNFDADKWMEVCMEKMYEAVYAKFSQNDKLREFLLDEAFDGKEFVEGSPFDGIWGVKIHWDSPKIDDWHNWNGLNLLGKILDRVRKELKNDDNE